MEETGKSKKRKLKKRKGIFLGIGGLLLLICAAGLVFLVLQYRSDIFLKETYINGLDVSGQTVEQAMETLRSEYDTVTIKIFEGEIQQQSGLLKNYGYNLDDQGIRALVEKTMSLQKANLGTVFQALTGRSRYQMTLPVAFDEEQFRKVVQASRLKSARIESVDAALVYDETAREYIITEEVYGNTFQDEDFQAFVKEQLDVFTSRGSEEQEGELILMIPEELYKKPQVLSDDSILNNQKNAWNKYCKAEIVYTFGEVTETLDWTTIQDFVKIDESGEGYLQEDLIRTWIADFAGRHDTRYYQRNFTTTYGNTVTFSGNMNEYGYTTDESSEYEQLVQNITSNTTVTREPVYYTTNDYGNPVFLSRNGQDDLNGTYVEVDLSAQHLWFYKNGGLVIESDFVSGSVAKNAETQTGVFPLAYKESPSVLVGSNAEDGYQTEVQFWMPFYEGQGLHDATWRSSFGGEIYKTNGSHGCVNLPYSAAEVIYNNIEGGTAIVVYK